MMLSCSPEETWSAFRVFYLRFPCKKPSDLFINVRVCMDCTFGWRLVSSRASVSDFGNKLMVRNIETLPS